jgi:hypothetical protein
MHLMSREAFPNRWWGAITCIAVVALLVRIAAAFYWQGLQEPGTYFRFGDSESYWILARTIADGSPYQYGSPDSKIFRAPLYPLFLSTCTYLIPAGQGVSWAAVFAARLAGSLLGAGCVVAVMLLTKQLVGFQSKNLPSKSSLGSVSAIIGAGLLATLYPGAIGMSVFILSEAIFCPLVLLSLFCVSRFLIVNHSEGQQSSWRWMLCAGALSGAACLARPSWSLWPAILFPYVLLAMRKQEVVSIGDERNASWMKRCILACLAFCLGVCMVMSPWWIRNYGVTGEFVPTTLQVGASLYDGWHPGASGSSDEGMAFVNAFIAEQHDEDRQRIQSGESLRSTFEWRLDRRLKNAAIQWATENSSAACWLGLVKLGKTWSPVPVARELGSNAVRWFEGIGYTTIIGLAMFGVWDCRHRIGAWLFLMPCVYFAVLHMFFIGSVRYRQPAVLILCVLGGVGMMTLLRTLTRNWKRTDIDGSITTANVTDDKLDK